MRFASLGSGSAGNALVVEAGDTRLLLDCGLGQREATRRLARLGLEPSQLAGILVTHEHDDHAGGAFKFAARYNLPLWLTHGTLRASQRHLPENCDLRIQVIDSHSAFAVGDLEVHPYPVPHDADEPVQYLFHDGDRRIGVLTDAGSSTPHIENMLSCCHALALECNHDLEMLMNGPYAWPLKQRVRSPQGHLDNETAAALLARLDNSKLQHIVAAHLSEKNNRPDLARSALAHALGCAEDWVGVASQADGFDWRSLS